MRRVLAIVILFAELTTVLAGMTASAFASDAAPDCAAFATQEDAQAWFDTHGGSRTTNAGGLDADRDGIACEHLPGVAASMPSEQDEGLPWLPIGVGIAGIGVVGVGGAAVSRRSRKASPRAGLGTPIPALPDPARMALPDDIPCDPPPGWPTVTPERAQALAAMPEAAYRASPEWTQRAEAILEMTGNRCQVCGADLMLPDQVRPRTRTRRGDERP